MQFPQYRSRILDRSRVKRRRSTLVSVIRENPGASAKEIHRLANHGYSFSTTVRDLAKLRRWGVVVMVGGTSAQCYCLGEVLFF